MPRQSVLQGPISASGRRRLTIALLLLAWATKSGQVGKLFTKVFDSLAAKL